MQRNVRKIVPLALLALVAFLLISGLSQASVGPYQALWHTAAQWDSGAKVNLDTATNSCLAQGNGLQLNATGSGDYGVSARCPTGNPNVSNASLIHAYNFNSHGSGIWGMYEDYGNDYMDSAGAVGTTNVTGFNGKGVGFGAGSYLASYNYAISGWANARTVSQITFISKFNPTTAFTGSGALRSMIYDGGQSSCGTTQYLWSYMSDAGNALARFVFQYCASGQRNVVIANFTMASGWHTIGVRINYTDHRVQAFADGAFGAVIPFTSAAPSSVTTLGARQLFLGGYPTVSNFGIRGALDDVQVFSTWLSTPAILAFTGTGTGYGTYASFGSWSYYGIDVTNAYPSKVVLGWKNVSGIINTEPMISGYSIWENTTGSQFDSSSFSVGTGNISDVNLTVIPNGSVAWNMEIDFSGLGTNTAQLSFVAVLFTSFTIAGPQLTTDTLTLILFLIAIAILTIMGFGFHPAFLIMDGVLTLFFAFWTYTQIASLPIAGSFIMLGAGFMVLGAVMKPSGSKSSHHR